MSSLRLRLLLLAALSIGATLALGGLALSLIFERHVERRVEGELRARWEELAGALTIDSRGAPELGRELSDPRYQRPLSGAYWQISDAAGARLRSRSLWDEVLPEGPDRPPMSDGAVELRGPDNSQIYLIAREVVRGGSGGPPQRLRLSVALDHAEINALRDSFAGDMAISLGILGAILLGGAALQASIGLSPLRLLRRQLADIQTGASTRLVGRFPDEVAPLASSLNLLLAQQEQQVAKARERAGDLAHGLKTPLSILAAEARRLADFGAAESAAVLREQVAFMTTHVDRELARARTRGASAASGTTTEVAETARKLVDVLERVGEGVNRDWTVAVPAGLRVRMDPHDFVEVLGNLLDNARKWARSRIAIVASPGANGTCTVSVVDDGPGIPESQRARLIQRGERGNLAAEGSGLGLSIVSNVLRSYDVALTLAAASGGGCIARFTVEGSVERARAADDGREGRRSAGGERVKPSARNAVADVGRPDGAVDRSGAGRDHRPPRRCDMKAGGPFGLNEDVSGPVGGHPR